MPQRQDIAFDAFVVTAGFIGVRAVFALGDGTVRLIDDKREHLAAAHDGAVLAAAFQTAALITGGDDGRVVATSGDGTTRVVAERPRKWIDQIAVGPGGVIGFAYGRQAVVMRASGEERTFDHPRAVGGIAFAPKGLRLAVARYGGVTLWFAGTDAEPAMLDWKGAHIGATFSPDGKNLVTTMQENAMHGWRLADSRDMRMTGYPAKPRSLDWSAKGRFLASSGANAAVLWPFHHKDGPMG
ncbi:MAG: WD40 repeat domain-containing protein, partial [Alphaproteobacteria bacterium]